MFIQVVTGKIADRAKFDEVGPRWETDVKPTAEGNLGGTVGTTADGKFFVSSRWESAEAAEKNNASPAQAKWFEEFAPAVTDVEYHNCPTVILMGSGNKDDAKFVQVMVGQIKDRAKFEALNDRMGEIDKVFSNWRSDVLGDVMAVCDDHQHFYDVVYFTNEADARAAESKEPPAEVQQIMGEMDEAADIVEYLDLKDPMLS